MARKKLISLPKLLLISILSISILGLLLSLLPRKVVEGHNRNFEEFASTPSYLNEPENLSKEQIALKEAFANATLLMQNNHYEQSIPYWHQQDVKKQWSYCRPLISVLK